MSPFLVGAGVFRVITEQGIKRCQRLVGLLAVALRDGQHVKDLCTVIVIRFGGQEVFQQ